MPPRHLECPGCQRILRTRTEVHDDDSENDHLYLMEASAFLHGMVKIGRSHDPGKRACALHEGMPFHMKIVCVYESKGHREKDVHNALRPFRVDGSPGVEWYKLSVAEAYRAIGAILFEENEAAN